MKVRILGNVVVAGASCSDGDIVEVNVGDGRLLVGMKKAEYVKDEPKEMKSEAKIETEAKVEPPKKEKKK